MLAALSIGLLPAAVQSADVALRPPDARLSGLNGLNGSSDPRDAPSPAAIMFTGRQLMPRIVRVHARDAGGRINIGSGVPIAQDLIATNCHVTRRAHSIELLIMTPFGPMPVAAVSQASSPDQDVCLLRTAVKLPMPPVGIGPSPQRGDAVVAIGFTGGINIRMHAGEVLALHAYDGNEVIQSSTAFDSGASGGGLFTADGRLVGLITFRSRIGTPRYFSAPAQWIKIALEQQAFKPIAPNLSGRAFWEHAGAELPEFLQADISVQSKSAGIGPKASE